MLKLLSPGTTSFLKRVKWHVVGHNKFPFCQTRILSLEHELSEFRNLLSMGYLSK